MPDAAPKPSLHPVVLSGSLHGRRQTRPLETATAARVPSLAPTLKTPSKTCRFRLRRILRDAGSGPC